MIEGSGRTIARSALVEAPPQVVYDLIADYHDGHGRIIPKPPFVGLEVEEGGYGEGTVIRVQIRVLGRVQTFRAVVSEPDPGHTLVETNDTGYVTTFTVSPRDGGTRAFVTISTDPGNRRGLRAAGERWLFRRMLEPLFERELGLIAEVAAERSG
jgi:hypothetical protein